MNILKLKELMIRSLEKDTDTGDIPEKLEEEGVSYGFSYNFEERVIDKIFSARLVVHREIEYFKCMNQVFYRIAFTGIAAIVLLLISIFLMEGSLSFNSLFGLSDNYDESIVCMLTGN